MHPGSRTARGLIENLVITRSWVIDLIEECRKTSEQTGHRCTVGIIVPPATDKHGTESLLGAPGHVLRFVTDLEVMEVDGRRAAVVHTFSRPVGEAALKIWAAGPHRETVGAARPLASEVRCMDSASKRTVRAVHAFFDIKSQFDRVRVGFTAIHHDNRRTGQALGLLWAPGCNSKCGIGHEGHLVGARTAAVDAWVAARFDTRPPAAA